MCTLTRYVLAELTKVFLISLVVLTALIIIGGLAREAIQQNLPPLQVLRLIPYILPEALRVAVPVTLLLAATSVYARMSGSNEVVAIKALGISPMTILWPAVVLAFFLSLATVWLNDVAVSWGRNGIQRVIVEAVEEIAYNMLRTRRRYSTSTFAINVKQIQGRRLILPTVSIYSRGSAPAITGTAQEAELRSDRKENVLKIILRNGTVDYDGRVTFFTDVWEQEIPLWEATRVENRSAAPSNIALHQIPAEIARQEADIAGYQLDLATTATERLLCGEFDELTNPHWQWRASGVDDKRGRLYRLQTEPHRRWSAGFSCLCFLWVGAPMAIRLRNRDFLTSFFLCFLPILIVYYPLLMYGIDSAKSGSLPPYGVWIGNILLLGWGAFLLRKVIRY